MLGPDVEIDIEAIDETNTRVDVPALLARFKRNGGFGLVGLIGVQSNQYPRALDIARPFRDAGIPVIMGGFHVSGCLSMLDGRAVELDACRKMGVSMFAGEAEGRLDTVLRDAAEGQLAPLYNFMKDLPGIEGTPVPFLPKRYVARTLGLSTSFDAGRGCPYQCSFCTIINVQGRKSRFRSSDDVEHLVRLNWKQGISKFFITDDNFARNKEWEPIFDRLIELREGGHPARTDDPGRHALPQDSEFHREGKARRRHAGLHRPGERQSGQSSRAKKRQNKVTEYRKMLLAWKAQGIMTLAGYILGFPADTPETIRRDIEIIKKELPLDIVEFFCLTPLPGSEDHQKLWKQNVPLHADLNAYDTTQVCAPHPKMTESQWRSIYQEAWSLYYSPEHMVTLLRRAVATGLPVGSLVRLLWIFATTVALEKVHPLDAGLVRLRHPSELRPGLRRESAWLFWPHFAFDTVRKHIAIAMEMGRLQWAWRKIRRDPNAAAYMDQALMPVGDDDDATLDLMTKTTGVKAALSHQKKVAELTHAVHAA